jgi:stage V sporulation protein R
MKLRMDKEIAELEKAIERIWEIGHSFGLDPFPTNFEIVPSTVMYEIGSYALPGRYSHRSFGKAYHRMKTKYEYFLSRIYEVVNNSNPSYGFLLVTNSPLQNKMVIAHVMWHVDFFKNNAYFSMTDRRMVDAAAIHAARISEYEFKHGRKVVERFLDSVLSIEEHVDPNLLMRKEPATQKEPGRRPEGRYDDLLTADERARADGPVERKRRPDEPRLPEKDLLFFLAKHSPILDEWQRDVVSMVRDEMSYFVPQMQTKTINEGWASFWHSRIMRAMDLPDEEHIEFAELHSSVVSPHKGQLNPYFVGYKILEDIERRWNEPSPEEIAAGRKPGQGLAKLLEVREVDNDVSLLRNYLTEELVEELDLFVYELVGDEWKITEKNWEKVRDQLVANMTNFGFPFIEVADGDYNGNRELYLKHRFEGTELEMKYARKTLQNVQALWGRPVHLETVVDGELYVMHADGKDKEE